MLKLTSSFYRYLTVYKAHVKKYSHLKRIREICKAGCVDIKQKKKFSWCALLLKQGGQNKSGKIKSPLNLDAEDKTEKMSKSAQSASDVLSSPSALHVSYGGTFVVSSDEDSSSDDYKKSSPNSERSKKSRQIPFNFRSWEEVHTSTKKGLSFKVLSYNVLAQFLLKCHPYLYADCPHRNLKWRSRSAKIYEEIMVLAPDIICLQEVQKTHWDTFYAKFERMGYTGLFKLKTGNRIDGCAIFFRDSVFKLKDHNSVEFNQPGLPLLNRDNIGIMVKLAPHCDPCNPFVVATTHLLYNPKRTDVRLAQMQVLLAEIDRFAFFGHGKESRHMPIILTGDFNSTPDSAVIKLLDTGHVSAGNLRDSSDWERIGVTDNCQHLSVYLNRRAGNKTEFGDLRIYNSDYSDARREDVARSSDETVPPGPFKQLFNSGDIWHTLQLSSVYEKCKPDGKYEASTYQDRWVTVDYIYFSQCSNIRLTKRLRLPTAEECDVLHRLPNEVFGSDHLALAASFELLPLKTHRTTRHSSKATL